MILGQCSATEQMYQTYSQEYFCLYTYRFYNLHHEGLRSEEVSFSGHPDAFCSLQHLPKITDSMLVTAASHVPRSRTPLPIKQEAG
jgi:hypothetical protein